MDIALDDRSRSSRVDDRARISGGKEVKPVLTSLRVVVLAYLPPLRPSIVLGAIIVAVVLEFVSSIDVAFGRMRKGWVSIFRIR